MDMSVTFCRGAIECLVLLSLYIIQESQCNDFLAGNVLRSANRYTALDETAVFGFCCRHEFPGMFVNLKHGERYGFFCLYNGLLVSCVQLYHFIIPMCADWLM